MKKREISIILIALSIIFLLFSLILNVILDIEEERNESLNNPASNSPLLTFEVIRGGNLNETG